MEAFENVVGRILEREGFWVRHSYKVVLTKNEKKKVGRPSVPAWDLDLVAYKGATNELWVVECKSYLGSPGVRFEAVVGTNKWWAKNFTLFNERILRRVVLRRLVKQLRKQGACSPAPNVRLCLAAGHVRSGRDRVLLQEYFQKQRPEWKLHDEGWIVERLRQMRESQSYENDVAVIVRKLLRDSLGPVGAEGGS